MCTHIWMDVQHVPAHKAGLAGGQRETAARTLVSNLACCYPATHQQPSPGLWFPLQGSPLRIKHRFKINTRDWTLTAKALRGNAASKRQGPPHVQDKDILEKLFPHREGPKEATEKCNPGQD